MRQSLLFPLLLAAAGLQAATAVEPSSPAPVTLWVTQLGADGAGSLHAAVEAANVHPGPDRIRFARGLYGTIPMIGPALTITDEVHIQGPGGTSIRLRGDGQNTILRVVASAGMTTIKGLYLTDAGDSAIVNEGAMLMIDGCTLHANFGARGAALASYGGDLHVRRSIVRDNYAEMRGGDLDGLGGGIYARDTSVTIEASRLSANTAESAGGGLYADIPEEATLLVRDSLIDSNSAWSQGGGVILVENGDSPSGFLNSTISGNRSVRNASIWFDGPLVINNSTVTDNYSPGMEIPGICPGLCGAGGKAELWLTSTLLSANRDLHGNGYDLASAARGTHVSHSLIERASEGAIGDDRGGNRIGVDPRIGPLLDNGGVLPTHALAADSPAIDAGTNPSLLQYDQRGACHARVIGSAIDIGAYEYRPPAQPNEYRRPRPCLYVPRSAERSCGRSACAAAVNATDRSEG